jgi:hypothetical protein
MHDPSTSRQSASQWHHAGPGRMSGSQAASNMQGQWQGYGHPQAQPPSAGPHTGSSQAPGQYGWQQWPGSNAGYYPPHQQPIASSSSSMHMPHPAAPVVSAAPAGKKGKKAKAEKMEAAGPDGYAGLGKRSVEDDGEAEGKKKGKKKEKMEDGSKPVKAGKEKAEKPGPPPKPAKSKLRPPRQANSAWQLFFTDELNRAKAASIQPPSPGGTPIHTKLNVAQIAKDAGAAYATMPEEQQAHYNAMVQESKNQYAIELAKWHATLTPEDIRAENAFRAQQRKEGKSRRGNLKDPNAPKKPLSAYFLFLKGIRENDELRATVWGDEAETTRQSVLAAERWRGLTDDEKKVRPAGDATTCQLDPPCIADVYSPTLNKPTRISKTMKSSVRPMKMKLLLVPEVKTYLTGRPSWSSRLDRARRRSS